MNKLLITSLSLSVLLSGCADVTNQGVGTVAGGVVGGLIGLNGHKGLILHLRQLRKHALPVDAAAKTANTHIT